MSNDSLIADWSDRRLVDTVQDPETVCQSVVDEYYRRCIPHYLNFIGIHWHTGYYLEGATAVSVSDQERMVRLVADSIAIVAKDRVLDVGCGIGGTAALVARDYGCIVHGLTPVAEQQSVSSDIVNHYGVSDRVSIDLGHASNLPYADASFDCITVLESPCHFPDRGRFFAEAFRVLKPGGRLAGEDWMVSEPLSEEQRSAWIDPVCKTWAIPMLDGLNDYRQYMTHAGFTDIATTDLADQMPLGDGFSVTPQQQRELRSEISSCTDPLWQLSLKGMLALGCAVNADAFTIGLFSARKPALDQ